MSDSRCDEGFGCFSTLLNAASLLNLDFLNERDVKNDRIVSGSDSEEVMLSEPHTGEESHSGDDAKDYEIGGRDDIAARDYNKNTTTETETEDRLNESEFTTVPESQRMDFQSNVVPAPVDATRSTAPESDQTNDSNVNSGEGGKEPSLGHSSALADLNSDLEEFDDTMLPSNNQQQSSTIQDETTTFPSQESNDTVENENEGTVREIPGTDSGGSMPQSSPTLSFTNEGGYSSSPIMFAKGEEGDREPVEESDSFTGAQPTIGKESTVQSDTFAGIPRITNTVDEQNVLPQQSITQQTSQETHNDVRDNENKSEIEVSAPPPSPVTDGSQQGPSAPKRAAPSLPPRTKGMGSGGLPPRSGGSSQQSSGQDRSRPSPGGFGGSCGLPPRQRPTQTNQPQAQRPAMPPSATSGAFPRPTTVTHARPEVTQAQRGNTNNGGEGSSQVLEPPEVVEARTKLRDIRLTMYRVVNRLGLDPTDFSLNEFMAKVDRSEQVAFHGPGILRPQLDTLMAEAVQLDNQQGQDSDLDITVPVLVLGLAGSGKTSVIQNILHPGSGLAPDFAPETTTKITVHSGKVCGINFNLIDTPGLSVAASSLRKNMNILKKVRQAVTKYKPSTVIYVDRMDLFRKEFTDAPVLRLVNEMLPELLYNCVALLTRASAPPPNCGQGEMSYNQYYRFRLDIFRQVVAYAVSDMRWAGKPMGFENHPRCRIGGDGAPILPNAIAFKQHAIFQMFASHMSGQIEKVCKTRLLNRRAMERMMSIMQPKKQLQLSALVAQLLTPKPPKKYPDEEAELLTKREIKRLSSLEEQVEEENKRRDYTRLRKVEILQEEAHPTQVPIVGASMELNPSFDHEVNQHRYNATDFVSGWSVRPILSSQDNTFDHDDGVEVLQVAREGVLRLPGHCVDGVPGSMIIQAGKGKNIGNITMETGASWYATRNFVSTLGGVVHPAGQDGEVVYTPTIDIRAKVTNNDKVTLGGMACRLAESGWPHKGQVAWGGKFENKYKVKDGVKIMGAVGAMTVKPALNQARDVVYGANVELKLAGGKGDFDPNFLFSGGVSHQARGTFKRTGFSGQISGEQAITAETMLNGRLQLSAGGAGTASVRLITHDMPQAGWLLVVPIIIKSVKRLLGHGDEFV